MASADAKYEWFSIPVEVKEIPAGSEFVVVSFHIDFASILKSLGKSGMVDERTLRLFRIRPDGKEVQEPIQLISDQQARHPERHLHPDTQESVSWGAEWPANDTSSAPNVSGELVWIASGAYQYKLVFGIPREGISVQVPFLPRNLRHFDTEKRPTPVRWFPRMQIRPQWPMDGFFNILRDGELLTTYHIGPTGDNASPAKRPYFYPVNGPDGIGLTELGKPHDPTGSHYHHYSLWIAHANVAGKNFWSDRECVTYHDRLELAEDGPMLARLTVHTRWETKEKVYLRERRQLTFYATPEDFRLMDVEIELLPGGSEPVELCKTSFGFLAARVAQSMTVFDGSGEIVNASGQRNEQVAHWQHAAWIDQSGPIAPEKWGGIALFDHPDNPNHPTAWHCRNDGWAGSSFNFDDAWTIEPDKCLRLRHGVLLHRHDSVGGEVSRRYEDYICRPTVTAGVPESLKTK